MCNLIMAAEKKERNQFTVRFKDLSHKNLDAFEGFANALQC